MTADVLGDWESVPEADEQLEQTWQPYAGGDQPIGPDGTWLDSPALCAWIRERSPNVLMGFSCGKDSIATWHRLREFWPADNIYPYFLYMHPHIGFIKRTLAYYERELGTYIWKMPHRSVYRLLNDATFQTPPNLPVIWGANFAYMRYTDIYENLVADMGLSEEQPWVAHGVRSADSPMRRMLLMKHGPWRPNERVFYPIHDWRVADVRDTLRRTGTKLPVDYRLYGRSFDGLDHRFTQPMRETFPEDYETLCGLYPLVPLDSWRRGGPKPDDH